MSKKAEKAITKLIKIILKLKAKGIVEQGQQKVYNGWTREY